jgi:hypothetical protein
MIPPKPGHRKPFVAGSSLSNTSAMQALEDEVSIKVSTHCGATEAAGLWFQGGNCRLNDSYIKNE